MALPLERYSRKVQGAGLTATELEILGSIGYLVWNMDVSEEVDDKSLDLLRMFQTTEFYQSAPVRERQCGYFEASARFLRHLTALPLKANRPLRWQGRQRDRARTAVRLGAVEVDKGAGATVRAPSSCRVQTR